MKWICADACFLIALYNEKDIPRRRKAESCFTEFFATSLHRLVVPWPALYETVSTKMARRARTIRQIDSDWKKLRSRNQLEFVDDSNFRDKALDECLTEAAKDSGRYRPLSLVDRVIRGLLSDPNIKIDVLLTFNIGDFSDVCRKFKKEICPY